jgi:sterol 24-C-methyltransferase
MTTPNLQSKLQRLQTLLQAFKAIYQLSPEQVEAYVKAYDTYECEWIAGQAMKGSKKVDYHEIQEGIINWYSVLNKLCTIGLVEKMYIPPIMDPAENFINNQLIYERKVSEWLGMKAGDKVFELGCGRGRITAHLASITGAHITAINIDQTQLDSAVKFAKKNGLSQQCQFMKADFNELPFPFPDNHFDCAYEVQALSISRDLEKLFRELHRVIKPDGKLCICVEWVRLPNYDAQNPHHKELMRRAKIQAGAIGSPSPEEYEIALRNAGFNVLMSEDMGVKKSPEFIHKAGASFDRFLPLIKFLIKIKLMPKHFILLFDQLGKNTDALLEAERLGLISMSYHLTAQKL